MKPKEIKWVHEGVQDACSMAHVTADIPWDTSLGFAGCHHGMSPVLCNKLHWKPRPMSWYLLNKAGWKYLQPLIIVSSSIRLISFCSSEIISGIFFLIAVALSSVSIKAFLVPNIHCGISIWDLLPLSAKSPWFSPRK